MDHAKKTGTGSLLALLFVAALLTGAVAAGLWLERTTVIQSVHFTGNLFTSDSLLISVLTDPTDLPADSVQFDTLFNELRALPYVDEVTVRMNRHGALTFQISEHRPIALLFNRNTGHYLSEKGTLLPVIPGRAVNVPLIQGIEAATVTGETLSHSVSELLVFLNAARSCEICWYTISEVQWEENRGITALTHEQSVKLIFGKNEYKEKLNSWSEFYQVVVPTKGLNSFRTLDLRFKHQIVARQT